MPPLHRFARGTPKVLCTVLCVLLAAACDPRNMGADGSTPRPDGAPIDAVLPDLGIEEDGAILMCGQCPRLDNPCAALGCVDNVCQVVGDRPDGSACPTGVCLAGACVFVPEDAGEPDAGVDAGEVDGGGCAEVCTVERACSVPVCRNGQCSSDLAPDGTPCVDGVCRSGFCEVISLTCGDGVLDPAEPCDDGNRSGGDTCDANCLSTAWVLEDGTGLRGFPTEAAPAIAEDGVGNVLAVWTAERASRLEVHGQLASSAGTARGSVLVITSGPSAGSNPDPVVTGLRGGGFVVAYWTPRLGITVRRVSATGELADEQRVQADPFAVVASPRVVAFGDGAVIAWAHTGLDSGSDPYNGVRARVLGAAGAFVGTEVFVSSGGAADDDEVTLGARDGTWFAAWTHTPRAAAGESLPPEVRFRSFGASPSAATTVASAPAYHPSLFVGAIGDAALVYTRDVAPTPPATRATQRVYLRRFAVDAAATPAEPEVLVTEGAATGERPAVALAGSGSVVTWNTVEDWDGGAVGLLGGASARYPLTGLSALLTAYRSGRVSTAWSSRGVWFTWQADAPSLGRLGTTVPVAYLVAVD